MMLIAINIRTRAVDRDIGDPFIQPVVMGEQLLVSNLLTHYTRDQNRLLKLRSVSTWWVLYACQDRKVEDLLSQV